MARVIIALLLAVVVFGSPTALAAPACTFTLGFKALHDAIPDVVGDCEPETETTPAGDVVQAATHGYLIWHRAYNRNTFEPVNGPDRYSDGPDGVIKRPVGYRFGWEPAPAPAPEYASLRDLSPHALVPPDGLKPFSAFTVGRIDGSEYDYYITYTDPRFAGQGGNPGGGVLEGMERGEGQIILSSAVGDGSCDLNALYCALPSGPTRDGAFESFRGLQVNGHEAVVAHRTCCGSESWTVEWFDETNSFDYTLTLEADASFRDVQLSPTNLRYAQSLAMLAEQLVPVT